MLSAEPDSYVSNKVHKEFFDSVEVTQKEYLVIESNHRCLIEED